MNSHALRLSLLLTFTPALLFAQDGARFGRSVLALGDLDEDGVVDFAVGAPTAQRERAGQQAGVVLVFSGRTRVVLETWRGEPKRATFGHTLRDAGDTNGDGIADVLVGYELGLRSEVRSVPGGEVLLAFDRNWKDVLPIGDADGDGADDFVLTGPRVLEVRSGRDGSTIADKIFPYYPGRVFTAGDLDGDGLDELVHASEKPTLMFSGRAKDGTLRPGFYAPKARSPLARILPDHLGGESLPRIEHVTAFGVDPRDWLLTAGTRSAWTLIHGHGGLPLVRGEHRGERGYAYTAVGAPDLDGDGTHDLVVGFGIAIGNVAVEARSAGNGKQLWLADWEGSGATTGLSLAILDDRNDDTVADILVGSSDWLWHGTVNRLGEIRLLSGRSGELLWRVGVDEVPELALAE